MSDGTVLHQRMLRHRSLGAALTARGSLCLALILISACAEVAPYQRGRLAHPTMAPEDRVSRSREHMQAVHEGAAGGRVLPSSGCGCN